MCLERVDFDLERGCARLGRQELHVGVGVCVGVVEQGLVAGGVVDEPHGGEEARTEVQQRRRALARTRWPQRRRTRG
jgi:hypothetical protein